MKRWRETAGIVERVAQLAASGERAALATVVHVEGSAYRRPGARFLVERGGDTRGGVSGGCLEADVRQNGLALIDGGAPRLLHYETGSNEETLWGLGLGCDGAIDVFVQPLGPELAAGPFARARELLATRTAFAAAAPFALATTIKGPDAGRIEVIDAAGESRLEEHGGTTRFVDVLQPPPILLVFGAGDDAQPLARLASDAGFDVTVVDHRRAFLTAARFPDAQLVLRRSSEGIPEPLGATHFAVVQTHSLQHDSAWLQALLPKPLAYVGLLGPRSRKEKMGVASDRLYAPIGLDLGAEGPEQVAVAIVAELLAVRAGRAPSHLRDRRGGIHVG